MIADHESDLRIATAQGMLTCVVEFGEAIKNPAYRIPQTEYSGCLDISAHASCRAGSSDLLRWTLQF